MPAFIAVAALAGAAGSYWFAFTSDHLSKPGLQASLLNWIILSYIFSGLVAWCRGGWPIRYIEWVTRNAAGLMTSAEHPTPLRESLAAFDHQRALIISAGTSPFEIAAARAFQDAAPATVDVWIAPDASHTTAYRTHPDEWERRVIEILGVPALSRRLGA